LQITYIYFVQVRSGVAININIKT